MKWFAPKGRPRPFAGPPMLVLDGEPDIRIHTDSGHRVTDVAEGLRRTGVASTAW
jgi:hypothetical protein